LVPSLRQQPLLAVPAGVRKALQAAHYINNRCTAVKALQYLA
jgi:hypothetical protein